MKFEPTAEDLAAFLGTVVCILLVCSLAIMFGG